MFLEQYAHQLSKPYLFIGNNNPIRVNNFIDKIRLNMAIRLFDITYNADRKKDGALFFVGKCYQALGKDEQALAVFKRIWKEKSFNPILFKEIGTTCLKLRKYDEGLQFAQKEVSECPGNAEAIANLAYFLLKLKRLDDAFVSIERAKSIDKCSHFVNQIYQDISQHKK